MVEAVEVSGRATMLGWDYVLGHTAAGEPSRSVSRPVPSLSLFSGFLEYLQQATLLLLTPLGAPRKNFPQQREARLPSGEPARADGARQVSLGVSSLIQLFPEQL